LISSRKTSKRLTNNSTQSFPKKKPVNSNLCKMHSLSRWPRQSRSSERRQRLRREKPKKKDLNFLKQKESRENFSREQRFSDRPLLTDREPLIRSSTKAARSRNALSTIIY